MHYIIHRVGTGAENLGKSCNFVVAFSMTGKTWKICVADRGKF